MPTETDLNPLASGAQRSAGLLHEYDFDLGSCPEGHAVESYTTLMPSYEAFSGLLNKVTKNYQAITDDNRSFVLQNPQEMTRCRMIDEWMETEIGQAGPVAVRQEGCSHNAPTIKWSRVISAIQAGLFCQANHPNDVYRGRLGDYEYIITKRQWNLLEKRNWNVNKVPSQSDWYEERNERQKVKAEYIRIANLLAIDAEKLRCLSRAIDEKNAVIEEFQLQKNSLGQLPAARHPSVTSASKETCHEDPADGPSITSVNDRDSNTTTPRSFEDLIDTCTARDHKAGRLAGDTEKHLFVHDLRLRGVPWIDVGIQYQKKFNIQGTCNWSTIQSKYSKELRKRKRGNLVLKVCPSRLRQISLGTTRSPLNPHRTAPRIGAAVSKPVVQQITPSIQSSCDEADNGVNKHSAVSFPETPAGDAVYAPFLNGLPLIPKFPRVSPGCHSEVAWSAYEFETST